MWHKKGKIFECSLFGTGYAQDAFIDKISDDIWRIYYSARTKDVLSLPFYLDVEAGNPSNILYSEEKPLFLPGTPGSFDETGITMTSIVDVGSEKYLYYCGWNRRSTVPYALSIGLIKVRNSGNVFEKIYDGPIMDRSIFNPISVSAPMVIFDDDIFKMWYITFTEWVSVEGKFEPIFVIKYATSKNGIDWDTDFNICLNSTYPGESLARPWVIKDKGIYKMWFSARGAEGYRLVSGKHYMIEYAESIDGINWTRVKEKFQLCLSENGWDSEMLAYASVLKHNDEYFMLYNGNYFGKTGFGYATSNSEIIDSIRNYN
jgi:hypothetical protein